MNNQSLPSFKKVLLSFSIISNYQKMNAIIFGIFYWMIGVILSVELQYF